MSTPSTLADKSFLGVNNRKIAVGYKNLKRSVSEIFQRFRRNPSSTKPRHVFSLSQSHCDTDMDLLPRVSTTTTQGESIRNEMTLTTVVSKFSLSSSRDKSAFSTLNKSVKSNEVIPETSERKSEDELGEDEVYEDVGVPRPEQVEKRESGVKKNVKKTTTTTSTTAIDVQIQTKKKPGKSSSVRFLTIAARLKQKAPTKDPILYKNRNIARTIDHKTKSKGKHSQDARTIGTCTSTDIILPIKTNTKTSIQELKSCTISKIPPTSSTKFTSTKTLNLKVGNKLSNQVKNKSTQFPLRKVVPRKLEEKSSVLEMELDIKDLGGAVTSKTKALKNCKAESKISTETRKRVPKNYIYPRYFLPTFSTRLPSNEFISIGQLMKKKYKENY